MEKFKEDNKGIETRDICVLFSYWQTNFSHHHKIEEKTSSFINFNSKSFNNKTYINPRNQNTTEEDDFIYSQKIIEQQDDLGPINSSGDKKNKDPNYSNNFIFNNLNNKILDCKSSFLSPNGTSYLNTIGSLERNIQNNKKPFVK